LTIIVSINLRVIHLFASCCNCSVVLGVNPPASYLLSRLCWSSQAPILSSQNTPFERKITFYAYNVPAQSFPRMLSTTSMLKCLPSYPPLPIIDGDATTMALVFMGVIFSFVVYHQSVVNPFTTVSPEPHQEAINPTLVCRSSTLSVTL
jgi:hypothetical protein